MLHSSIIIVKIPGSRFALIKLLHDENTGIHKIHAAG